MNETLKGKIFHRLVALKVIFKEHTINGRVKGEESRANVCRKILYRRGE